MEIFIIKPYRKRTEVLEPCFYDDLWYFDDPVFEIKEEQFLNGSDIILSHINKQFSKEAEFFYLILSNHKFENYNYTLELKNDNYALHNTSLLGKLPDKLLNYFRKLPKKIYLYAFRKDEN